jgi:hypothetical protein
VAATSLLVKLRPFARGTLYRRAQFKPQFTKPCQKSKPLGAIG